MRTESDESKKMKYFVRATFRTIKLLLALFVLFLVVAGIVYLAPRIWAIAIS